jgi:hypothetical protein
MKNLKRKHIDGPAIDESNPKKYRVKNGTDVYYTFPHWTGKEIEGVEFVAVVKRQPSQELTQVIHYLRKDSLELVK